MTTSMAWKYITIEGKLVTKIRVIDKPINTEYLNGMRVAVQNGNGTEKFSIWNVADLINEIDRLVAERTAMIEKINELINIVR